MGINNSRAYKVKWMRDVINEYFKKHPNSFISRDKLVAEFAIQNNSTRRTGLEILNLLHDTGFINIADGKILKLNKEKHETRTKTQV